MTRRDKTRALGLALLLTLPQAARAFPLLDATSEDTVPLGTDLAPTDAQSLQHQLAIVNGLAAPAGGGWSFVPHVNFQEELTDNALQLHSPRQWDAISFLSPGINIAGDLPRLQLSFSFAPTLAIYARTSSLNALTEQLNGVGTLTVIPDLAFVDVRAVSGVHSQYGGLGGLGTVGAATTGLATASTTLSSLAGNAQGLNRDNEVQTSSYGISPYLLRRFGDYGTGKLGYSMDVSRSDTLSGFASLPYPTGGTNGQTLYTNEEIAQFTTGEFLERVQDSLLADLSQSTSQTDQGFITATGLPGQAGNGTSTRDVVTDTITWQLNRAIAVFASGGHENIVYSGTGAQNINDLTWSLGTTLTPNPDSSLTISYGHQNGFNSISANGHYAATARTVFTASYGQTLGTQLQTLQNQLNLATANGSGGLANGQTGAISPFASTNALAVEDGVFKTTTFNLGATTTEDRDTYSINLLLAQQTSTGAGAASGTTSSSKTVNLAWVHSIHPDMTLSASLSYGIQTQGLAGSANPGNSTSVAANVVWQYQISETVSTSVSYSFVERASAVTAFDIYQNLLIFGISKSF